MGNRERLIFIVTFLILFLGVYNIGDGCIKNRDRKIDELNQKIESLESELKEKTDILLDLGYEEEVKLDFCSVCDDKYVYIEETTSASGDTVYYIECNKCQFIFGYYSSKSELISIWNSINDN